MKNKINELKKEIETNKNKFNKNRLIARNVIDYQNSYFRKQDLLREKIKNCERQEILINDLKEIGVIK